MDVDLELDRCIRMNSQLGGSRKPLASPPPLVLRTETCCDPVYYWTHGEAMHLNLRS